MVRISRRQILVGAPLALLAAPAAGKRPQAVADRWRELDALAAAAVAVGGTPGLAVAVARNGEEAFSRGYGLADVEARRAVTPDTPFCIASITKQMIAALFLILQREGRLRLDDPMARWLPDFPYSRAISLRMLLNHTSGLADYIDVPRERLAQAAARDYSDEEIVAQMAAVRPLLTAPPGTVWSYVNTGYVLLGVIAKRAANLPIETLLADRLFRPAGMSRTAWGPPSGSNGARGYTSSGGGWRRIPYVSPTYVGASGAIWSTVGDLCSWQTALHAGGLLRAAEITELLTPARVPNRPAPGPGESTYGLGIRSGQGLGRTVYWHSGNTAGFSADLRYYPAERISIAMLANTDAASRMAAFPRAAREAALRAIGGTTR